ncbi:hypothetical protein [Chryseobacterium sp. T1]
MKNLLTALSLVLGLGFASAQSTHPSTAKQTPVKVSQEAKKAEPAKQAKAVDAKAAPTKSDAVKLKKDGTPDKRYKENQKLKKDGTPDKRYKQNK